MVETMISRRGHPPQLAAIPPAARAPFHPLTCSFALSLSDNLCHVLAHMHTFLKSCLQPARARFGLTLLVVSACLRACACERVFGLSLSPSRRLSPLSLSRSLACTLSRLQAIARYQPEVCEHDLRGGGAQATRGRDVLEWRGGTWSIYSHDDALSREKSCLSENYRRSVGRFLFMRSTVVHVFLGVLPAVSLVLGQVDSCDPQR
jgi:hypothetical protein